MDCLPYLRIRFEHRGRGWQAGDCFNLLQLFYQRELGISLPGFSDYSLDWDTEDYFLRQYAAWGFAPVDTPEFGDVVLLCGRGTVISHCGIVIDPHNFLHTSRQGTAVHPYSNGYWTTKIHAFYRYQGYPSC